MRNLTGRMAINARKIRPALNKSFSLYDAMKLIAKILASARWRLKYRLRCVAHRAMWLIAARNFSRLRRTALANC
jgi:hypothetical protein